MLFFTFIQISQLEQIDRSKALEIIKNTLKKCPELIDLDESKQNNLATLKADKFKNKKIVDITNLYTMASNFYKFINKILLSLKECVILESKLLIQSLNFSLLEYDDKEDYQNFFKKEFRLLRGIKYQIETFQKENKIGDLIVFPGFTSTSLNFSMAKNFADQNGMIFSILFEQQCWYNSQFKKSRPKSIKAHSTYKIELEYLFPCFSCFTFKGFKNNIVELEYQNLIEQKNRNQWEFQLQKGLKQKLLFVKMLKGKLKFVTKIFEENQQQDLSFAKNLKIRELNSMILI